MPQGTVRVVLDLHFDGDYYEESERAGMAETWIDGGLEDRSDLRGWTYAEKSHSAVPAAKLPTWDEMSDLDRGAALLHLHKCESEGTDYATEEYPARYLEAPALVALDGEDASGHAQALFSEDVFDVLGAQEYDRLYDIALDDERKR